MRQKYGCKNGTTVSLTKKIKTWKQQIRRIDKRNEELWSIIKMVNEYFDVNISSKSMNQQHKMARKVYYKYGIEKGFCGVFVSEAIKKIDHHTASNSRQLFTKSFKHNTTNRDIYHNFLNRIKYEKAA